MKRKVNDLEKYIAKLLGEKVLLHPSKIQDDLPFFLSKEYDLFEAEVLGRPCLFISAKSAQYESPSQIKKRLDQIRKKWQGMSVYVPYQMTSYLRKRLIDLRLSFIVPNSQFYLPEGGLDLTERFPKRPLEDISSISPSTQALIIYVLLNDIPMKFRPTDIAAFLEYTPMTIGRSFDELRAAHIGQTERKGKELWWAFEGSKQELWKSVKPYLRTPVKRRTSILQKVNLPFAGFSALAYYTMLSEPRIPIYAMSQQEWKQLKKNGVEEVSEGEADSINLEIWSYNPQLLLKAFSLAVDPLSLFLSMDAKSDERVEAALKQMMENIKW